MNESSISKCVGIVLFSENVRQTSVCRSLSGFTARDNDKLKFVGHRLSQESILQPAINRNHMPGRLRQSWRNQQEDCFGLVFRFNWRLRQRSSGIKSCQLLA